MTRRKNIFADMDGTIFEWNDVPDKSVLNSSNYYKNIPIYKDMKKLIVSLTERANIYICTAIVSEEAVRGKNQALDAHFGKLIPDSRRIFVPDGNSKAEYASEHLGRRLCEDDILLDDHTPNLIDWEIYGGTAIKVLNGKNGRRGVWKGTRMTLDGRIQNMVKDSGYDGQAREQLIYAVYEQAVQDFLNPSDKEHESCREFLKDDPYGFGTKKICKKLKITIQTI